MDDEEYRSDIPGHQRNQDDWVTDVSGQEQGDFRAAVVEWLSGEDHGVASVRLRRTHRVRSVIERSMRDHTLNGWCWTSPSDSGKAAIPGEEPR